MFYMNTVLKSTKLPISVLLIIVKSFITKVGNICFVELKCQVFCKHTSFKFKNRDILCFIMKSSAFCKSLILFSKFSLFVGCTL